jgi:hypothetical protein
MHVGFSVLIDFLIKNFSRRFPSSANRELKGNVCSIYVREARELLFDRKEERIHGWIGGTKKCIWVACALISSSVADAMTPEQARPYHSEESDFPIFDDPSELILYRAGYLRLGPRCVSCFTEPIYC